MLTIYSKANDPTCLESFIAPFNGAPSSLAGTTRSFALPVHTAITLTYPPPTTHRPPANRQAQPRVDAHEPLVGACRSKAPAALCPASSDRRQNLPETFRLPRTRGRSGTHMRRGAVWIGSSSCVVGNAHERIRPFGSSYDGRCGAGAESWAVLGGPVGRSCVRRAVFFWARAR